jgi:hypothetical protein
MEIRQTRQRQAAALQCLQLRIPKPDHLLINRSIVRNETSEVFCQFSQGEIQFSPIRRNQAARNYDSSVREQMFEHAVFGSASAL